MSEILAVIGNTDLTNHIVHDTYAVNSEPVYESWTDGNFREHRIYIRDRVKGSFDIAFLGADNQVYQDFLDLLANETHNRRLTIGLYVLNDGHFGTFEGYYTLTSAQHAETTDGRMVNKMTFDFEEC